MAAAGRWLTGVVLTALAGSLARSLAPKGRGEAAVRLAAGLLLAMAVLGPLGSLTGFSADLGLEDLTYDAGQQAARWRGENEAALSAIIEERCASYIWDKADRLGLACRVEVRCAPGEGGLPLPDTVTVTGPRSEALSAWIQEEVGIPAEKQIWLEEDTWSGNEEKNGP